MAWFYVDDNLAFNPKVITAGNPAMGLWVRAGAWSMSNLTDGFVPVSVALQLGTSNMCNRLSDAGLFDPSSGGFQFHNWDRTQTSAKDIKEKRAYERRRKAEQRKRGTVPPGQPPGQCPSVPPDVPKGHTTKNVPMSQGMSLARAQASLGIDIDIDSGGYVEPESPVGSSPPPTPTLLRTCNKHPDGTIQPCGACQKARMRADTIQAAQDLRNTQAARAQFHAELETKIQARHACPFGCAERNGYRPNGTVCDHIDRTETHRNGIAQVSKALQRTKIKPILKEEVF